MSDLKYIVIPEPVVVGRQPIRDFTGAPIPDGQGGVMLEDLTYSLLQCVTYVIDNDVVFSHPASSIRAGGRILEAFEEALQESKPYAKLEGSDHKLLDKAFESPSQGYGSFFNSITENGTTRMEQVRIPPRSYLPHINAVNAPVNTEPKHLLPPPPPAAPPAIEEAVVPPLITDVTEAMAVMDACEEAEEPVAATP